MSPLDNPQYKDEADAIVVAVSKIRDAIVENGMGTVSIMIILGEMLNLSAQISTFNSMPTDQRDEFFAEVWDSAIGNEPNALVTKVGVFEGEYLEAMSDGLKGAALAHFNKTVALAA